jgi:hypothetical protein
MVRQEGWVCWLEGLPLLEYLPPMTSLRSVTSIGVVPTYKASKTSSEGVCQTEQGVTSICSKWVDPCFQQRRHFCQGSGAHMPNKVPTGH